MFKFMIKVGVMRYYQGEGYSYCSPDSPVGQHNCIVKTKSVSMFLKDLVKHHYWQKSADHHQKIYSKGKLGFEGGRRKVPSEQFNYIISRNNQVSLNETCLHNYAWKIIRFLYKDKNIFMKNIFWDKLMNISINFSEMLLFLP